MTSLGHEDPAAAFDDGAALKPRRAAAGMVARVRASAATNALLIGVVVLVVTFARLSPYFFTVSNFRGILVNAAPLMVVVVPMALLIIAGGVDLSVGSTLAFGAVITGLLLTNGTSVVLSILAGIVAGAAVGTVNGLLVTRWSLSPIIITLGALSLVRGLCVIVAPDPLYNFRPEFTDLGSGASLGVPYLVLVAIAVFLVGGFVLAKAPVGRHIYAIGVNREAAYLSGVRVRQISFLLFIATGAAAGLAGVMLAARLGAAPSGDLGVGFELDVLTAVLLGGVAFDGGRGRITGVLLGVLFLGILQNGLTLQNVPASTGLVLKGLMLGIAAALDRISTRAPKQRMSFPALQSTAPPATQS
jgi:ribose transport system permease protein